MEKRPSQVTRDPQFQLAHPGDKGTGVMAGPVSQALFGTFSRLGAQSIGHLRFKDPLHGLAHDLAQEILVFGNQRFEVGSGSGTLLSGHGVLPFFGVNRHHSHTMTFSLVLLPRAFAHKSVHYRAWSSWGATASANQAHGVLAAVTTRHCL